QACNTRDANRIEQTGYPTSHATATSDTTPHRARSNLIKRTQLDSPSLGIGSARFAAFQA
ncbi:hypothetical protein, partial [Xanthomonas translucens]|uniref:hypothetical protein n=1 Tax=Xanthomonas campestris pv. translucens TaxID=343 RepID=UPI0035E4E36F